MRFNDEIDQAVELLDTTPQLDHVITHEFPANQAVEAFAVAKDSDASGKVLVSLW
jgi:L-idonate 5-dehydrogenase